MILPGGDFATKPEKDPGLFIIILPGAISDS